MTESAAQLSGLTPLPYHCDVLSCIKEKEPQVWAWASSLKVQEQHTNDLRAQLLRDTYRLTSNSHSHVYELCNQALARLQIDVPVTLYQANSSSMNASLFYLPDEAHVVLHGPVIERLKDDELLALLGHELAHFKLWSEQDSAFLITDRILGHSANTAGYPSSYPETARLFGLHTELYADRGAALASGSVNATISMLVKVHTGAAEVDPSDYLLQAIELDQKITSRSEATSHPESFLRSQAIDMWWRQDPELDTWLRRRLQGPMELTNLDLLGQVKLTRITREFIARVLQIPELQTEEVLTQAKEYFPDWSETTQALDLASLNDDQISKSVKEYLHYVMLDLALTDPALRDHALANALQIASQLNSTGDFVQILKRDLKMNKRQLSKLEAQMKGSASA